MWLVHRTLDFLYLMPLMANALWLKEEPKAALKATWLPMLTMGMMMPSLAEDFRGIILWLRTVGNPADLGTYCAAHGITTKLIGMGFTSLSCLALIFGYKPAGITDFMVQSYGREDSSESWEAAAAQGLIFPPPPAPLPTMLVAGGSGRRSGRQLQDAPLPDATIPDVLKPDDMFPLWVFLAVGLLFQMQYAFSNLVMPDQPLGILFIMIDKMATGDISKFMKVFLIVLANYGFAMYIAYPHTGSLFLPLVAPSMNGLVDGFQALVEMAILGENISLDMSKFALDMSPGQIMESVAYIGLLYYYIIMALILLLNLLIAMMGDTYGKVQEQAVREWRVANLQLILRLEILARPFTATRSGTSLGGEERFVLTRTYDDINEGGEDGAGDDPNAFKRFDSPDGAVVALQRAWRRKIEGRRARKAPKQPPARPPPEHDGDWDYAGDDFWDSGSSKGTPSTARGERQQNPFGAPSAGRPKPNELPNAVVLPPPSRGGGGGSSTFAPSAAPMQGAPAALDLSTAAAAPEADRPNGAQSARPPAAPGTARKQGGSSTSRKAQV